MARARRPTGDTATNARKRYYRSAERYLKKADQAVGVEKARYEKLAQAEFDNALETYSSKTTQKFSKPIQKLAKRFGVNLENERKLIKSRTNEQAEMIRNRAIKLTGKSSKSLVRNYKDTYQVREQEAKIIFASEIGRRILGGTVDIWKDGATVTDEKGQTRIDKKLIYPILMKHYKVDSLSELLNTFEEILGEDFYKSENDTENYKIVSLLLQKHTIQNETN